MENLSLHILDIAENSVRAGAATVAIGIETDAAGQQLTIRIQDDGEGMSKEEIENALDPFYTTKKGKKIGLGLCLLDQACRETGGTLTLRSEKGVGTEVVAVFNRRHPDMKPLGELPETLAVLIAGQPDIRFVYNYTEGMQHEHFNSGNTEQVPALALVFRGNELNRTANSSDVSFTEGVSL
jgi:anti-sigma regulatory factor (Ser/Thr protein kinase)